MFFFLTETSNAENKATVYFACKNSHVVIISFLFTVHQIMCDSQVVRLTPPTLPSLLSILKAFPVRQYAQAACDTEGTSIILCVRFSLEHSSDPSMKSQYELVKTLLVLMTDVIGEGSGEHVCLHHLVRVSLTNKV